MKRHAHAHGFGEHGEHGPPAWAGHHGHAHGAEAWSHAGPDGHGGTEAFSGARGGPGFGWDGGEGDFGGGAFGVRRPLRFLAHKLDLDDKQVDALASILNELKTERAQAAVDHRRTVSGFADVIAGESFDGEKAGAVAGDRVKSAERLRDALVKALQGIHALLRADQRARFAYLIRTGALSL